MKQKYSFYTHTTDEWDLLYDRIKADFEVTVEKHIITLHLTDEDLVAFNLKYGDRAVAYHLKDNYFYNIK